MRLLVACTFASFAAAFVLSASACSNVWGFSDLSTGSDGGAQGNAPPGSDGGQNAGFVDGATPPTAIEVGGPFGLVEVSMYGLDDGGVATTGMAQFAAMGFPCTKSTAGACVLFSCAGEGASPTWLSAGTITVTGGAFPFAMTPSSGGYGAAGEMLGALWSGGETLTVAAPGDVVPAFSTTILAPTSKIALTEPQPSSFDDSGIPSVDVSRLSDFVVQWTGAQSGQVDVGLSGYAAGDGGAQVPALLECLFDGPSGSGTVPSALLQQVPPGPGWTLRIDPIGESFVDAGSYAVLTELVGITSYPGGGRIAGMDVNLQ